MTLKCIMILGDCLDVMPTLRAESHPMLFADMPWQKTPNHWDTALDYERFGISSGPALRDKSNVLLMDAPYNIAGILTDWAHDFRYELVYEKARSSGFLDCNRRPLRAHELVWVFGRGPYIPQKTNGLPYSHSLQKKNDNYGRVVRKKTNYDGQRYPRSVLRVAMQDNIKRHPTQKPVALLDWLIRTYSNPGDNVLDPVSGSFTTSVAACLSGRSSVGIEKDSGYFEAGLDRVRKTVRDNGLDVAIEVRR